MPAPPVAIRSMIAADIEAVCKIERQSFTSYWTTQAYVTELSNPVALYLVAESDESVIGYGGLQVIMDEAHITTVAVEAAHRGKKIGERLLAQLLADAMKRGATRATLEVRETNEAAKRLYEKYGFVWVAVRKAYYGDNKENADILWLYDMEAPAWQTRFEELRAALASP